MTSIASGSVAQGGRYGLTCRTIATIWTTGDVLCVCEGIMPGLIWELALRHRALQVLSMAMKATGQVGSL